jgi:sugar phosphate permease
MQEVPIWRYEGDGLPFMILAGWLSRKPAQHGNRGLYEDAV